MLSNPIFESANDLLSSPKSVLSSGPVNPEHKTFVRNEKKIQHEVIKALANRNISTRVSYICKRINLSQPTFYLHHRNCNEALVSYENDLLQKFAHLLLEDYNRIEIFTSLLFFIYQHCQYFRACFEGWNFYLIIKMLLELRPYLVSPSVGSKTYIFYMSSIIALLVWWGKTDHFSKEVIPEYIKQLTQMRIVYYE